MKKCKEKIEMHGNTDINVSKICLGCMSFGKAGTMHDWTLDAAGALNVKLTDSDMEYLDEMYISHPIVGAINHNHNLSES